MIEFTQHTWDDAVREDCRQLIRLAVREDLEREHDWTTHALVPSTAQAAAQIVAREVGVIVGIQVAHLIVEEMNLSLDLVAHQCDGAGVAAGTPIATVSGSARDLLTAERTLLNFMGPLSGIATLTQRFTQEIAHTTARLYDTRKTTPGWRRLEKYAVRCGGGWNHRTGLYDAILIKDNHLAFVGEQIHASPADAAQQARRFVAELMSRGELSHSLLIEIELDSLHDFETVLAAQPDIILLDNMSLAMLSEAVSRRNALHSTTQLEASGGVRLSTIRAIAETGVDRISCGALTHSAVNFDVALDWLPTQ
jgi:nicotinate-nucleotide pyrophosphorylase (carboxylating)